MCVCMCVLISTIGIERKKSRRNIRLGIGRILRVGPEVGFHHSFVLHAWFTRLFSSDPVHPGICFALDMHCNLPYSSGSARWMLCLYTMSLFQDSIKFSYTFGRPGPVVLTIDCNVCFAQSRGLHFIQVKFPWFLCHLTLDWCQSQNSKECASFTHVVYVVSLTWSLIIQWLTIIMHKLPSDVVYYMCKSIERILA